MSRFLNTILCFLLLLPVAGRGQEGIIKTIYGYEINPSIFKNAGVRNVLRMEGGTEKISLTFDTTGRIISRKENDGSLRIDSFFLLHETSVVKQIIYNSQLLMVDSTFITKTYLKQNDSLEFDQIIERSYKTGEQINSRNNEYNLHHQQYPDCTGPVFHSTDKNVANTTINFGDQASNQFNITSLNKLPQFHHNNNNFIPFKTNYNSAQLYLTGEKLLYSIIKGGNEKHILNLKKKESQRYFIDGEVFSHHCAFNIDVATCGGTLIRNDENYSKNSTHKNKKNLTDTVYREFYPVQKDDEPCIKPKDSSVNFYLYGRAGMSIKEVIFYYRYEYFDE
ncbi:hypothetical protein [Flavobacterium sp. UBA7682]|uniref:hypothetical protein n=1 Tax=Flavobacterium sp. UBA7682 TaxID=1946560 RepID=UPI0025C45D33|nr:hypothetical protein [Flavobacterium sp. UBA7682]